MHSDYDLGQLEGVRHTWLRWASTTLHHLLSYLRDIRTSLVQYLDTYCRYLRDDYSIAKVTIYCGIS